MHSSNQARARRNVWRLAYVALAAVDTTLAGSSRPGARRARFLTKPMLMPTLAASTMATSAIPRRPLVSSTLVAQAFSWGGDVALLRHGTAAFATGTASFGAAHAAYVTGFRSRADTTTSSLAQPAARVVLGVGLVGAPVLARGAARTTPVLGPAVLGYAGLITAMTLNALRLDDTVPAAARQRIAAGALLFLASDAVLGLRTFVLTDLPGRIDAVLEVAVMATYTSGQLLLADGAARAD